jgi:small-conductance mechanosensitive channel
MIRALKKLFVISALLSGFIFSVPSSAAEFLPDIEIDENENSQKILEILFELISSSYSGDYTKNFIEESDNKLDRFKAEFNEKHEKAEARLFELEKLINAQQETAPYFASFYFRQIVDLKDSYQEMANTIDKIRLKVYAQKREFANQLEMLKTLKIPPELEWQKNWINSKMQPVMDAYSEWLTDFDEIVKVNKEFLKNINTIYNTEEKEIEGNYSKYYNFRFAFFGNPRNMGLEYHLKQVWIDFTEWQVRIDSIIKIILPNINYLNAMLFEFALFALLGLLGALFLRRKFKEQFSRFLRPYMLGVLGAVFFIWIVTLPSTNDIIVFTAAAATLSIAGLDMAWKLRKPVDGIKPLNPFIPFVFAYVIFDLSMSMLAPVEVILTLVFLVSICAFSWATYVSFKKGYTASEKIFGGLVPGIAWLFAAIASWLGFLYFSMFAAVLIGLTVCALYCGSVFTQKLAELAGAFSQRQFVASFIFTLMIPLMCLFIIIGALTWAGQIFNASRILEIIYNADLVPNIQIEISPKTLLYLLISGLVIKFILNWIRHIIEIIRGAGKYDTGNIHSVFLIFQYIVWCIFIVYALNSLNIDWNGIKYVIGGMSVGFGFALKDLLENFVCGIILLIGKEVRPGDVVEFDGTLGTVEKINIRATFIKTNDNAMISLPNVQVVSKDFRNWTLNNKLMRSEFEVGVQYGSDVEKVVELLIKAANESSMVAQANKPEVLFCEFGDNALIFKLRFWINVDNINKAPSQVRIRLEKLFRENNIVVAFPQLDLHFPSSTPAFEKPVN